MEVLWQNGPATVHQLLDSLPRNPALAYNSVLTTIRILERKGYVRHLKEGRAHIYRPLIGREEATRTEVRHLLSRFFNNSHELLVLNLLEDKNLDEAELKRLREFFQDRQEEGAEKA